MPIDEAGQFARGVGFAPGEHRPDPWMHRTAKMSCATCMWFVVKVAPEPQATGGLSTTYRPAFGRCRRHAPTMSGYPAVYGTDWCGDHKLDEAKA